MWHHPWWGIGGGIMVLLMLLFWVAVIVGIYLLIRVLSGHARTFTPGTPRAILDRRLASGEISADEYDALRKKIEG